MRARPGPTFKPALSVLVVFAAILFFTGSEALRLISALALIVGIALAVAAIATPDFLEADAGADESVDT